MNEPGLTLLFADATVFCLLLAFGQLMTNDRNEPRDVQMVRLAMGLIVAGIMLVNCLLFSGSLMPILLEHIG